MVSMGSSFKELPSGEVGGIESVSTSVTAIVMRLGTGGCI